MARVEVYSDRVVIRLTTTERLMSLRGHDIVLQRSAITSAVITDDPWVWLRGVRASGPSLPQSFAAGVWRSLAGRDFVLARKGRASVVIDLRSDVLAEAERGWKSEFDAFSRVVISTVHASELVSALRMETPGETVVTVHTAE